MVSYSFVLCLMKEHVYRIKNLCINFQSTGLPTFIIIHENNIWPSAPGIVNIHLKWMIATSPCYLNLLVSQSYMATERVA